MDISVVCEDEKTAELIGKKYPQVHIYRNVFPYVFRYEYGPELKKLLETDEILVRTADGLGFLIQNGFKGRIIADAGLYTFNRASKQFLKDAGVCRDTVPLELNYHEIRERGVEASELMIYGHVPMMISAQCLYKNTKGGCEKDEKKGHRTVLVDRMGKSLPVICFCRYCFNVIYNSVPLSLHTELEKIRSLDIPSVRLSFTVEKPEEALAVTGFFIKLLSGTSEAGPVPFKEYTKGHFIKGVE